MKPFFILVIILPLLSCTYSHSTKIKIGSCDSSFLFGSINKNQSIIFCLSPIWNTEDNLLLDNQIMSLAQKDSLIKMHKSFSFNLRDNIIDSMKSILGCSIIPIKEPCNENQFDSNAFIADYLFLLESFHNKKDKIGNSEIIKFIIDAKLWDIKNKKTLLSYSSIGESFLINISYEKAMEYAIQNSIHYLVQYLVSGKEY